LVQPGQGFHGGYISFKDFGVKLQFTPIIMRTDNIHLKVAPEVSTLDFSNALTISGFTVPALSTRKAERNLNYKMDRGFVIAGLMTIASRHLQQDSRPWRYPDSRQTSFSQQEFAEKQIGTNGFVHRFVGFKTKWKQAPPPPRIRSLFWNPEKFDKTHPNGIK